MKFVIGLGNPGSEYEKNRHNVGYYFVELLAKEMGQDQSWQTNKKMKVTYVKSGDVVLVKPEGYMNNSGLVSRQIINFFTKSFVPEDVIVIHDDLDIKLGDYKLQLGKGPKTHNGLLDLDRHLNSTNYWHLRVGVDNRLPEMAMMSGADYVLSNFTQDEERLLLEISQKLINQVKELIDK